MGRLELTEAQKREDPKSNGKPKEIHCFLLLGALRRLLVEPSETVVGGFFGPLEAILGRHGTSWDLQELSWTILGRHGAILGPLGAI